MGAQSDVIDNGVLYIRGGAISAIQEVGEATPEGFTDVPVTRTGGTIFPGLIELHNHLPYNILPLWQVPIPSPCPNEVYERAMAAAVARAVAEGFTQVAFGDLFLEDIRQYRIERLSGTGLRPLFPLFGADTDSVLREVLELPDAEIKRLRDSGALK